MKLENHINKYHYIILLAAVVLTVRLDAEDIEDMRMRAAIDLFPSFLAADTDIVQKKGSDDSLLLLVVYTDNRGKAEEITELIKKIGKIRNMPIRMELVTLDFLTAYSNQTVAGIFISQQIYYGLETLIRFAEDRHVILFSPFQGDVERGITGGIVVKEKILPFINIKALNASGIRMKEFFLRVSESYSR